MRATRDRIHIEPLFSQRHKIVKFQTSEACLMMLELFRFLRGISAQHIGDNRLRSGFNGQAFTHALSTTIGILHPTCRRLHQVLGQMVCFLCHAEQLIFLGLFARVHTQGEVRRLHDARDLRQFAIMKELFAQLVVERPSYQTARLLRTQLLRGRQRDARCPY